MKKVISALLAFTLLASLPGPARAASPYDLERVRTYTEGQFADVPAGSAWADNVETVYELGLMAGVTDTYFDTEGNLTVAQTIAMACRLHDAHCEKEAPLESFTSSSGGPWYQPYVEYAALHKIIELDDGEDLTAVIDRGNFAGMMYSATPLEALEAINTVEDGAIPDLPMTSAFAEPVYALYRAGVLTGNDEKGLFTHAEPISRGAAAAIISRIADSSLRRSVTLVNFVFQPVAMADLANLSSIQKGTSDEELALAYDKALELVTPYAGMSLENRLRGIANAMRELYNQSARASKNTPHADDPYGCLVLGSASAAGYARATGLCLNILGIPYEHVNEDQGTAQWCRVQVGDIYWICDAYGLHCGPEPAPYAHPNH